MWTVLPDGASVVITKEWAGAVILFVYQKPPVGHLDDIGPFEHENRDFSRGGDPLDLLRADYYVWLMATAAAHLTREIVLVRKTNIVCDIEIMLHLRSYLVQSFEYVLAAIDCHPITLPKGIFRT